MPIHHASRTTETTDLYVQEMSNNLTLISDGADGKAVALNLLDDIYVEGDSFSKENAKRRCPKTRTTIIAF